MSTPTTTPAPENGVDRCDCGCKYWTEAGRCADCGDRHERLVRRRATMTRLLEGGQS